MMDKKKEFKSALSVKAGIKQPPTVNPDSIVQYGQEEKEEIFYR